MRFQKIKFIILSYCVFGLVSSLASAEQAEQAVKAESADLAQQLMANAWCDYDSRPGWFHRLSYNSEGVIEISDFDPSVNQVGKSRKGMWLATQKTVIVQMESEESIELFAKVSKKEGKLVFSVSPDENFNESNDLLACE